MGIQSDGRAMTRLRSCGYPWRVSWTDARHTVVIWAKRWVAIGKSPDLRLAVEEALEAQEKALKPGRAGRVPVS